jgi:lipoprotein-anchoring transpeptidase ErfK/SrfK
MNKRTQSSVYFLVVPMKVLLIVATAVCLLSTLASWVLARPVQTALARAEGAAPPPTEGSAAAPSITEGSAAAEATPPAPTPATVTDPPRPLATPEPTVEPTTVAPTPTSALTSTSPSHVVQEGETARAIAQAYGVSAEDLVAVNDLLDPHLLYVGQTLRLPEGSSSPTPEPGPTAVPARPTPIPPPAWPDAIAEERWIDVDLSQQVLTAYEGSTPVHSFLVSTGLPATPTPVGQFRIWIKLRYDDMAGADYYIEDVPYVMYFHEGYGLHGVTWHGNFGHPMSHGCVNLPTSEAEWLFNWADVGTPVNVRA